MQEELNKLKSQVEELTRKVEFFENNLPFQGIQFEELIRNTVMFDNDQTSRTQTYNVAGGLGGTVTSVKTPSYYVKSYFRGSVIYIPVYTS